MAADMGATLAAGAYSTAKAGVASKIASMKERAASTTGGKIAATIQKAASGAMAAGASFDDNSVGGATKTKADGKAGAADMASEVAAFVDKGTNGGES